MPGFLLHIGAQVQCSHGGLAEPAGGDPGVMVGGQPVITIDSIYAIQGCPFTVPPGVSQPCLTADFITASTRITAQGQPVLLQDSQSICAPNETPLVIGLTQTRVRGM